MVQGKDDWSYSQGSRIVQQGRTGLQGIQGPQGPQGPPGPQGPMGVAGPSFKDAQLVSYSAKEPKVYSPKQIFDYNTENVNGSTFSVITTNIGAGTFEISEKGRYLFIWSFNLENTSQDVANMIVALYKNGIRVTISGVPKVAPGSVAVINGSIDIGLNCRDQVTLVNESNIRVDAMVTPINVQVTPAVLDDEGYLGTGIGSWVQVVREA
ncbi:MAG: hypothetical protein ACRCTE_01955 [Cellulosilyticaceae bacterium]